MYVKTGLSNVSQAQTETTGIPAFQQDSPFRRPNRPKQAHGGTKPTRHAASGAQIVRVQDHVLRTKPGLRSRQVRDVNLFHGGRSRNHGQHVREEQEAPDAGGDFLIDVGLSDTAIVARFCQLCVDSPAVEVRQVLVEQRAERDARADNCQGEGDPQGEVLCPVDDRHGMHIEVLPETDEITLNKGDGSQSADMLCE